MNANDLERSLHIARSLVTRLQLDLDGLCVVTECASGSYAMTPVIAALAGARVHAVGRDTSYGTFDELSSGIRSICEKGGVKNAPQLHRKDQFNAWSEGDIITNSGMLRPLDAAIIRQLKETAVIALMWETWEFRKGEIDLAACRERGIPVIGTNEHFHLADMYKYPGLLAIRLLFDLKIDVANNRIALLGGALTGRMIADTFRRLGLEYTWFTHDGKEDDPNCRPYAGLKTLLSAGELDALLIAEHEDPRLLLGENGLLRFTDLRAKFPHLRVGHICGNIDAAELRASGLICLPEKIAPFGYMSFLPETLGPKPTMLLNAAGLKVGELGARVRLRGGSAEEAIAAAVAHGIGQDFPGGFLNYRI